MRRNGVEASVWPKSWPAPVSSVWQCKCINDGEVTLGRNAPCPDRLIIIKEKLVVGERIASMQFRMGIGE